MLDIFAVCLAHSVSLYIQTEVATVLASLLVSQQSSIIIPTMKFLVSSFILFKSLFILPQVVSNFHVMVLLRTTTFYPNAVNCKLSNPDLDTSA